MLVRDWMTPEPLCVLPATPVQRALTLLRERGFRRLLVVDEQRRLLGITTRKDLKDAAPSRASTLSIWEVQRLQSQLSVGEVMASSPITARENEYMEDAALRMRQHAVGGLPVVSSQGEVVGIITVGDVLEAFTQIMGLRGGGERLSLTMPDVPGSLERAAKAAQPSNIISLATGGAAQSASGEAQRRFVMRVVGPDAKTARQRVRAAGIEVD